MDGHGTATPGEEGPGLPRPAGSFGARFVDELMRVSGSRAHFRYKLIQDLRRAEREKTILLLRREGGLEYRWIARMREVDEPETVAREMWVAIEAGRRAATSLYLTFGIGGIGLPFP